MAPGVDGKSAVADGAPGSAASADLPPPPAKSGSTGTTEVRARITVSPWTDMEFTQIVREVLADVRFSAGIVFGSGQGVAIAERMLRERGYPRARVVDARDVDEAMRRVAHWVVLRDG